MNSWTKQQKQAIEESGKNIIVSAGAGSGKTAVLSARVINKLENNINVDELLILTFTRAAADEMKYRIRKNISKNENLKEQLIKLNSAYITTFDSFALSIVKKYHYVLNISKDIKITDETIVKIEAKKMIDKLFEKKYQENDPEFLKLIDSLCINTDKNIRKNIIVLIDKINTYIDKEKYMEFIKNDFFTDKYINDILDKYIKIIKDKQNIIKDQAESLCNYFDESYCDKVRNSIDFIINASFDDLTVIDKVNMPNVPRSSSDEAKNFKSQLKSLIDELLSFTSYGNKDKIKESIISNKNIIRSITTLIQEFNDMFDKYKKENNIYTFNDIAFLAIKIIKENKNIQEEIRNSFKEIMIDEYQDTNDIQTSLIDLISNNNLYMVGDIKQSIYGFRDANPEIFKNKYNSYSNNDGGVKIDLLANFRSRKEVLNNINNIFNLIMDLDIGGADYINSHQMNCGNTLYETQTSEKLQYDMEILTYNNKEKESGFSNIEVEIFTIAKDIEDKIKNKIKIFDKESSKLREVNYNDFVIIIDRSKYFDIFKKVFEYKAIPLTILKEGILNASDDLLIIKQIISFLIKFKRNEDFKHEFVSIARSFLYEYSDDYIFNIVNSNNYKETSIYKDLILNIDIVNSTLNDIFNSILDITDFYNKLYKIGDYQQTNIKIEKISSLINDLSDSAFTIEEFYEYLCDIIDQNEEIKYEMFSSNTQSVKILTIHKSKGLEYPICYFADLDHKFNKMELNDKFILSKEYGIIIPDLEEKTNDSILKELYKYEYNKNEVSEKIRLFYVALTRAREHIVMVLPNYECENNNTNKMVEYHKRLSFNKLSDIVNSVINKFSRNIKLIELSNIGLTKDYLYNKSYTQDNKNIEKINIDVKEINIENTEVENKHFSKENIKIYTKEEKKLFDLGTLVHRYLELIDYKNKDVSLIKDDFIKEKILMFLNNEILKNINSAKIYNEYEFIYEKNDIKYHGIIDLMLEYDDHIDIIDFKLKNIDDELYLNQLNGYKEYIQTLSSKNVDLYLYSIYDGVFKKIEGVSEK